MSAKELKPSGAALDLVPMAVAKKESVLPLALHGQTLKLLVKKSLNLPARERIRAGRAIDLDPILMPDLDFNKEIEVAYRYRRPETLDVSEAEHNLQRLIDDAVREGASDIHFEPTDQGIRVRFRCDGELYDVALLSASIKKQVIARLKVMSGLDTTQHRRAQDGKFCIDGCGRKVDFRLSILPTTRGEKAVLRVLDPSNVPETMEGLGMDALTFKRLRETLATRSGLVLVTGPTGSGKTTSQYAMLRLFDRTRYNVMSIEDPVEYDIEGVTQTQVDENFGVSFSSALRSILRQDPDIIMVGEIRDLSTAELAIRAAITGHLVLATLHTSEAASAPARLVDMGVQPYQITASLKAVVAQRLLRRLCVACRKPAQIDEATRVHCGLPVGVNVWRASGCERCSGRGTCGRVAAFELMTTDKTINALIANGAETGAIRARAIDTGMTPMANAALALVEEGVVSLEEVLFVFPELVKRHTSR